MSSTVLTRLRRENRNEIALALAVVAMSVVVGVADSGFWSWGTVGDVLRDMVVPLPLALGVLLILLSSGIDVSFASIAIFSAYATVNIVEAYQVPGIVLPVVFASLIGAGLGAVNAVVVAGLRLPTLIATLATRGLFSGALLMVLGAIDIGTLPGDLPEWSNRYVTTLGSGAQAMRLHVFVIPVVLLTVGLAWFCARTASGRNLYAVGGDPDAARRLGIPVRRVQATAFVVAGTVCGLAGLMYVVLARHADPHDLMGTELDVVAAVILGGAAVSGGRGTVWGTVLGVLLVSLMQNSLTLLGIPGLWQRVALGALLLVGMAVQVTAQRAKDREVGV